LKKEAKLKWLSWSSSYLRQLYLSAMRLKTPRHA